MKPNIKKLKKPFFYIVGIIIGLIVGIYVLVGLYSFIFEQDKLAIDRYNFEQLEKAKPILESIPANARKFYTLKDFNTQYKANIQPKENCYYVSNYNGEEKYIFGFQLESKIYKLFYLTENYSFYKYSLPFENRCIDGCYDHNEAEFRYTISYPCVD